MSYTGPRHTFCLEQVRVSYTGPRHTFCLDKKFQTKFGVSYTVTSGCSFWCKKKSHEHSWDLKPDGKVFTLRSIRDSYETQMLFSWRKSFENNESPQYLHEHGKSIHRSRCDEKRVHRLNLR